MLTATLDEGAFSHLVLNRTLAEIDTDPRNKSFIERLFHGTLEQVIYLDWIISSYSSVKMNKIKPVIRNILRMSIYQILFMDSVPDHAAINEAVKLTKARGYQGLVPFVNGLLRAFQRGGVKPGMPENVKHSVPGWIYQKLVSDLGKKKADRYFDTVNQPKNEIYARLVLSRAPKEEITGMLKEDGCEVFEVPEIEEAVRIRKIGDLTGLEAYKQGLIFIQDLSSIRVGHTAYQMTGEPDEVKKILDVCAAPGGKSLHLAERFPQAEVTARDLSETKVGLINENIERSRLTNIRAEVQDALVPDESCFEAMDIVLADLPCSGLGVIGRKPDIKLRLKEEDIEALAGLQRQILEVVRKYVKPGGLLLYSTCTVTREENRENAAWFEENFPFRKLSEQLYLPGESEGDGFNLSDRKSVV